MQEADDEGGMVRVEQAPCGVYLPQGFQGFEVEARILHVWKKYSFSDLFDHEGSEIQPRASGPEPFLPVAIIRQEKVSPFTHSRATRVELRSRHSAR